MCSRSLLVGPPHGGKRRPLRAKVAHPRQDRRLDDVLDLGPGAGFRGWLLSLVPGRNGFESAFFSRRSAS